MWWMAAGACEAVGAERMGSVGVDGEHGRLAWLDMAH